MSSMIFLKQSICFLAFCLSSNFLFTQTTSHYNTTELKFGEIRPLESFFEDVHKPFMQILYLIRDPDHGTDSDSKKILSDHRAWVLSGLDSIFTQDQGKFPGLHIVHFASQINAQRIKGKNDTSLRFCDSKIVPLENEREIYVYLPTNDLVNAASEVADSFAFRLENMCGHVYEVVEKNGVCITSRTIYAKLLKALFTDNKISQSWMQYTALERIKRLERQLDNQNEQFSALNKNFDEIWKDIDRLSGNFNSLTKRKPLELTFRLGFSSSSTEVTPMISDATIDFGLSTVFENRLGFEIRTIIDTLKVGGKTTYGFQGGLSTTRYRQRLEFADFEFAVSDAAYVPSGFQSLLLRGSNLDERLELSFTSLALGGFVQYPFSENLKLTLALAPTLIFVNNVNSHIDEGQYSIYGITQGFELEVTNVDSLGLFQDLELPNASQGVAYRTLNVGLDTQISLQYNLYRNVSIELNLLRSGRNIAVATDEFDVQRMLTGRDRDTFVKINQPSISGAWFGQIGISIAL